MRKLRLSILGLVTCFALGSLAGVFYIASKNGQERFLRERLESHSFPMKNVETFFAKNEEKSLLHPAAPVMDWAAPAKTANTASKRKTFRASQLSANDRKIMANAVYGESRGEPYMGQVAVAAVILNRVKSSAFPNTPSGVIFEPRAFTAVADGQIWLTPNETASKAVNDALKGWDPTGGCTYYFNPATATSGWIWSRPQVKKIGKHIFCR